MSWHRLRCLVGASLLAIAAGCAATGPSVDKLLPADLLLVGEQHDDAGHQVRHRDLVQALAVRDKLAAVAIEMAEQGSSTAGLPREADDSTVRASLRWDEAAWPWQPYAPAIMAAVRAGVPVLGANLPRDRVRAAMQDESLDSTLDPASLEAQRDAVRTGHCDLLPEAQLAPMARVQIARDRMMARTLVAAAVPGQTVLLLAGAGHVDPALGVPRHLPPSLTVRSLVLGPTGAAPARDHCAELRQQWQRRPPAS
ncbi:ChaN family lipoprotein [Ramlibacter sp. MMS24-I3-19]|uniref:ChaN family lipoprotein n=1 Tax=Ramlibacter sp. MMS24-I3-19 TaxID=3416606 RepID=UPI003D00CE8C